MILKFPYAALTDTDPRRSTSIQILMPAAHGGVGLVDPPTIAAPCCLASNAACQTRRSATPNQTEGWQIPR
eukprot:4331815-Prymnesium_polylepis.2